jgi:hypothetical protein
MQHRDSEWAFGRKGGMQLLVLLGSRNLLSVWSAWTTALAASHVAAAGSLLSCARVVWQQSFSMQHRGLASHESSSERDADAGLSWVKTGC